MFLRLEGSSRPLFPLIAFAPEPIPCTRALGVGSKHLILIVEDELWLSLDISEALKDEGYDVITVPNADDAIKASNVAMTFTRSSRT